MMPHPLFTLTICSVTALLSPSSLAATINVPADQPTIQAAINAVTSGVDEVLVAPGTYNEIIDLLGKAITVRSTGGATVTTIDAGPVVDPGTGKPVVRCDSGEGPDTVLDGFTFTGGTGDTVAGSNLGAGMYIKNSSPTVLNCVFRENMGGFGGGAFTNNGSPLVANCAFIGNVCQFEGGGLSIQNGSNPTITSCMFSRNIVTSQHGGGMFISASDPTVTNCTFSRNSANLNGGGIFHSGSGTTAVANCIFWENADVGGMDQSAQIHLFGGTISVNFSDVQGGWTGTGANNINADPFFVDAANDNLRLLSGSPAIDAGSFFAQNLPLTDLDGNVRVQNCRVDMGAYEFVSASTPALFDVDCDGDVDGFDFTVFASCWNRAGNPPRTLGCAPWNADQMDVDDDGDVDGVDFAVFAACFNKAGNPPRPPCRP